jgi:hypothetical protein
VSEDELRDGFGGIDQPPICSICGTPIQGGQKICPNCGNAVENGIWPPRPVVPHVSKPIEFQGHVGDGVALGCGLVLVSAIVLVMILTGAFGYYLKVRIVGAALVAGFQVLAYVRMRTRKRLTARGLGITLIISWTVILLGLSACYEMFRGL